MSDNDNILISIYTSKPLLPIKFIKKFNCIKKGALVGIIVSFAKTVRLGTAKENIVADDNNTAEEEYFDDNLLVPLEQDITINQRDGSYSYDIYEPEIDHILIMIMIVMLILILITMIMMIIFRKAVVGTAF